MSAHLPVPLNYSKLALEPPRGFLPRLRLTQMLGRGPRPKVVLVCAPAGSGKSTLLYQIASSSELPAVYLRLDTTDGDLTQFISYLTEGICQHEPAFGTRVRAHLSDIEVVPSLLGRLKDIFIHEVSELVGRKLWIVLDDYHQVDGIRDVAQFVGQLADAIPTGIRLVVASRGIPMLPITQWRLQGDLLEVQLADLTFTWAETRQLFREVLAADLDDESVRLVHLVTEGWAAGLMLAYQVARSHSAEEMARIVGRVGLSGSPIYDYLAEQVYASLSPTMRTFLRRGSVLNCLSPGMCNELLGIDDSERMLVDAYRTGLFLLPLERAGVSFRYHQLFQEFLQSRLKEEETPEQIRALRIAAGRILESRRQWDEAILQYTEAGDEMSAIDLIVRFGEQTVEAGQALRVSKWLQGVPAQISEQQPMLLALRGLISLRLGDTRQALRWFERCGLVGEGEVRRQAIVLAAKYAGVAYYREGRHQEAVRVVKDALELGAGDAVTHINLQRVLGVAHRGAGDLAKAEEQGREVLRLLAATSEATRAVMTARITARRNLAETKLLQGDLDAAVDLSRDALRMIETEESSEYQHAQGLCVLGGALAARGDFEEAVLVLEQARQRGADFYPRKRQTIAGWLGNVYRDTGDLARAERDYAQASGQFAHDFAFLLLRQGRVQESLRMAQKAISSPASLSSPPLRASGQVSFALGLKALGMQRSALRELEAAAGVLREYGYGQRYASACMHLAGLYWEVGDQMRSGTWLQRWLGTASQLRLRHFQWWDPPLFARALAQAFGTHVDDDYSTLLAIHRLEPNDLVHLQQWLEGTRPGGLRESALYASGTRTRSIRGTAQDLEHLLASCRDSQIRAVVESELGRGRTTREVITRLRDHFHLTWKELLVFLSYYLQASYESEGLEEGLRARVASQLCMSEHTLKCHISSIRRKLGMPHRIGTVGMLAWCSSHGITPSAEALVATGTNSTAV